MTTLLLALLLLPAGSALDAAPPADLAAPASNEAWARALVAALPRATAVNDANGDKLFDDLQVAYAAAGPLARLPVIVSFVQGTATDEGVARAEAAAPGAPVERRFTLVPAYAGALRLDEALAVARLPEVRQVELDDVGRPELETATAFMGADAVVDGLGVTGSLDGDAGKVSTKDVVIAILDTGFDVGHEDVGGKLVHWMDLGDGKGEPYDSDGHGTHVLSIAAGWGRDPKFRGVAPGAGVVGLRINDESDALMGYEWIVKNKDAYGIRVATMSFGFGVATDGTTALERAVDAAWDAGVVCFKSNGNSGPGRSTMTVPAAARGILGIGSLLDPAGAAAGVPVVGEPSLVLPQSFGFQLSSFSSRGPTADGRVKPDLAAPGHSIEAAQSGTKDGHVALSGTSMASPFAAGSAALVIAANPSLTPDQVRETLVETAEDWGVAGPDVDYGHGRIRVDAAVRYAQALAGAAPAPLAAPVVPYHEVRAGVVADAPFEGTFKVNDTKHPIAATFIAEGVLLAVEVQDASGLPLGRVAQGGARQAEVAFQPEAPGEYRFRVVAAPGTAFVVDFSHGTAPTLLDEVDRLLPASAGELPGATQGDARVPAPGLLAGLGVLAVAALVLRRRLR